MAHLQKRDPITPPTIDHFRVQGLRNARIFCSNLWCGHMVIVACDDIGLPRAMKAKVIPIDQDLIGAIHRHTAQQIR